MVLVHNHHVSMFIANLVLDTRQNAYRYQQTKKVTLVGAVINVVLSVVKIVFGYVGQSQSLIADGIHSLSDLATDALVLFADKHSTRHADDEHPYGHGRIETVFTVALGGFLLVVACGIAIDAARRLLQPDLLWHPGYLALSIAVVSVLSKELLYHYTMRVAIGLRSNILKANAWHHRSDAISSILVVAGIAGTMMGFSYLDAIASIGLSMFILKIGWDLSLQSLRELIDTALEPERVAAIRSIIQEVDGVRELHSLRTRRMGGDALVDVHILVEPKLSVSEGHHISEYVRQQLIKRVDEVTDVMVHIDPEDDEAAPTSDKLPQRHKVLEHLKARWSNIAAARDIDSITLHYLDGKIQLEISLPLANMHSIEDAQQVANLLRAKATEEEYIEDAKVFFH